MGGENISVSVRVRPLSSSEDAEKFDWASDGSSLWPLSRPNTRFVVDNVFGPATCTSEIYECDIRPLIEKAVAGINATFFAYGQTSSGKTYTIQGIDSDEGVVSLAVRDLFLLIKQQERREYLCRASYLEIYNEEINDLLCGENERLPLHETKDGDVYVGGLTEEIVNSPDTVMRLMRQGESTRHTGATKMNERSSRSHTIFRMIIESRHLNRDDEDTDGAVWVSTLNLVDLAGSERIAKTGAEGLRMKEGTAINKSLLNLGIVINQLAHQSSVISYRDSKVTRILQRSLGGNAKTAILCNITPAGCHVEESSNTLRFGCRAKKVVNIAHVNEVLSDEALLKRQAKEIESLKKRLAENGNPDIEFEISQMRAALLRSEHEKELMQIKLDEEKAKKEKAERQVQVAKQLMFSQEQDLMLLQDREKRRDTWCPGHGAVFRPLESTSANRMPDAFATPPSSKRLMKARQSTEVATGADGETSDARRMSTEDVRQLVRDLVDEKAELQRRLAAATEEETRRRSQIQSMEADLKAAYNAKGRQESTQGATSDASCKKMRIQIASLKLRNREMKMEQEISVGLLRRFLKNPKLQTPTSAEDVSEMRTQIKELQKSEKTFKKALQEKKCMCDEITRRLENKAAEIHGHLESLKDFETEMQSLKEQHGVEIEEFENTIDSLRIERDDLEAQVTAKHEELSITKKSRNRSESQMNHMGKERDLHTREVDRLKKRLDEQEGKMKGMRSERVYLQSEKGTLERKLKEAERGNETLKSEAAKKNAALEKRKDTLQHELTKARERSEDVAQERTAAQAHVKDLQNSFQSKQTECDALRREVAEAEENLKRQGDIHRHQCSDLQMEIVTKNAETAAAFKQIKGLKVELSTKELFLETINEQLEKSKKATQLSETAMRIRTNEIESEAQFRIDEITIHQQCLNEENAKLKTLIEGKEDENLQQELRLMTSEEEMKGVKGQLKEQAAEYERGHQNWRNESELKEKKIVAARQELSEKEEELGASQGQVAKIEAELQRAMDSHQSRERVSAEQMAQLTEQYTAEIQKRREDHEKVAAENETFYKKLEGKEEVLREIQERLVDLESEHRQVIYRLGATEQEASEWKKAVNTTRNVEEWVKSLSDFIYELKFQSNQLLADFDEEENHIPTKNKTEAKTQERMTELTEALRSHKKREMELYGVLRVLRTDIAKNGWEIEKFDELLQNSRKAYRGAYTENKLQRVERELQGKIAVVVKLEAELREVKKHIPPSKLEIDLTKPPPESFV